MVEPQPSKLMTWVRFPLPAPLSKIVAPDESVEKSTVKVDFFVAFILKKEGWCGMISTIKRGITIEKELHSKIEWACTFSNCKPKIKSGNI